MRIFKLSREETVDVHYEVEAESIADAVRKLRDYDESAILLREVLDHCSNGDIYYFGSDTCWHPAFRLDDVSAVPAADEAGAA